jgi:hypothetical protein
MSAKSKVGKAECAERAARFRSELEEQIARDAADRMSRWAAAGRIPLHVRITARLAGRPVRLNDEHRT